MFILLVGCAAHRLERKSWHVSAGWHASEISSTLYPAVEWDVILKLRPGMSAKEAKDLIGMLQSYHHPVNAIVFSRNPRDGKQYEVALKLSKDKTIIEDISFKCME